MGISNFLGNVKIQGGMSHFQRNTFKRERHTFKEMSNSHGIQGNISFQGNVTFS